MKEIEVTSKTIDEAKKTALEQLGAAENEVEIVVLKKGRAGVLGVGAEEAKIRVSLVNKANQNNVASEAREVLETLIKYLGVAAEIHITSEIEGQPVTLNIEGDDLGALIGRHGQALLSLQYILRIIIAEKLKAWIPINVDVAGYKKRRYESLHRLALRLADQVKANRRSINLEPMPADERRVIHLALADHPDVATQSTGVGEERKVVILLRKR
jgi:spoIIIJ-associated protein